MRFDRIDLQRYGCFTDHIIDFKDPSPKGDFHIIYGPNEAGKSTLRSACLDFLFGIPARSKYNFLHDYSVMEIGAQVTADGQALEARRIKGNKSTLLASNGTVISETSLEKVLGGISRENYEQMYSLDDDSLEKGGESILGSNGDLGALLFSAMSGLSDISTTLSQTQNTAEEFFKTSGRTFYLNSLKHELEEIKAKLRENDVETSAYTKLREQAVLTKQGWEQIKVQRDGKKSRLRLLQSLLGAYPVWKNYNEAQEKLSGLSTAPDVPESWDKEVNELIEKEVRTTAIQKAEQEAVERAEEELKTLTIDENVLGISLMVKRLNDDDLEARYKTSPDIGRRQEENRLISQRIKLTLKKLGQSDAGAGDLILKASLVGELRDLIEKRGAIVVKEQEAEREWEEAEAATKEAQNLCNEAAELTDLSALVQTLKQIRKEPDPDTIKIAERAVETARTEQDAAISALAPWQGSAESLVLLQKPAAETVSGLLTEQNLLTSEQQSLTEETSRLNEELSEVEAEINALLGQAKIISDENAQTSRANHEAAWREHRDSLDQTPLPSANTLQATADCFAEAFAEHDRLLTTRLTQTSEIAQLRQAQVKKVKIEAAQLRLKEKIEAFASKKAAHEAARSSILNALLLPPEYPLNSLEAWLSRLDQVKEKTSHSVHEEQQLSILRESHTAAQNNLDKAMKAHDLAIKGLSWTDKLENCEVAIEAWKSQIQRQQTHKEALKKAQEIEGKRKRDLDRARKSGLEWQEKWSACLTSAWIGQQSPEAVKEILSSLESLEDDVKEEQKLSQRIEAMTEDRETYVAEVSRLALLVAEDFTADNPIATADRLRERVNQTQEAVRAREKANKALLDAQKRLAKATENMQEVQDRFGQMQESIPAESLDHLREEIRRGLQKAELLNQVDKLGKDLIERLNQETIEQALELMENQMSDATALESIKQERESLEGDLPDIEEQVSTKYHEWQEAENQLASIGTDSLSAELEEQKRTLLLQIEAKSHEFMQLSAGILLANAALRTYRETHRSSMMEAASEAFVRMTRGAFKGLVAAPRDNTEVLVGIRADGSSIVANEMSRGTRYQLYLALRIAGHAEFARHGETLPFFADDILEPFDDDRSQETFSLLHSMSKNGQVVYLTHHKHLCDLAKKVTDGKVMIHELPDRAVSSGSLQISA